jgi:hypothetical protein
MPTPFYRRPGVTIEQLTTKRAALCETLHSPAHQGKILTRDYGDHDPRIAPFPPCTCGGHGSLSKLANGKWTAKCNSCDKKIDSPQAHDWQASLQWCSLNLAVMDYRSLPLFGIQNLDSDAAKVRLVSIYDDLLLRCQIGTLDVALAERGHSDSYPGYEYLERIYAYRDWAKLCLSLVKRHKRDSPDSL